MVRWLGLVLLIACSKEERPSTPQPGNAILVSGEGAHTLAYSIDAFPGIWRADAKFTSQPGSALEMDVTAKIGMRFEKSSDRTIDVFLEGMTAGGSAAGGPTNITITRANTRPAAFDAPMNTLTFGPRGPSHGEPNPKNPIARQGANLIDAAVFLMPSMPEKPVAIGARWTATRVLPNSHDTTAVEATINYELRGIATCPKQPASLCATIQMTANTGTRKVEVDGDVITVSYDLEGATTMQLGGALVDSKVDMSIDMTMGNDRLLMRGTMTYGRS